MQLPTFKLEDYLSKYEFSAPHLLCCSDAESWSVQEIINMANEEELGLWNNLRLSYTEVKGLPALRSAIGLALYPGLAAEQILCAGGAEEAIFCTFFALLQPQEHVIVLSPVYQSLFEIPKLKGCSVTTIELKETNNWRIDLDEIKRAIQPKTKWLIMNFPHNPSGQIITQSELKELIQLLDHHGIWLFSDEVYRLLGPFETDWALPAACLYEKAISLGVMSKAYGMAGLRIGWIACQDETVLSQVERIKHYTTICNSAPSEILSLITLHHQESVLKRNNRIVDRNLKILDKFFLKYEEKFSWVRPQGGCVGFVKYKDLEPVDSFCHRLVESRGTLLMPASIYNSNSNHFRIGFGRENMPEALEQLEEFIQ